MPMTDGDYSGGREKTEESLCKHLSQFDDKLN
jgi:hypothetical protein